MTKGFWTSARLAQASRMWNRGDSTADMAKHFGVSRNAIHGMTGHRRDRFPHRRVPAPSIDPVAPEPDEVEPIQHPGRVINSRGVTLARVAFIDGPASVRRVKAMRGEA